MIGVREILAPRFPSTVVYALGNFGGVIFYKSYLLQQALDSTRLARDIISNSSTVTTIFWSPGGSGAVGVSVGESVGTQEGGFSASFSLTDYQQIWPYGSVLF